MQYFPLFIDTQQCQVLVIGGGEVAARKVDLLARTQAQISLISPTLVEDLQQYVLDQRIQHIHRKITQEDLQGWDLIYCATDDDQLNLQCALLGKEYGAWVNVVDKPSACDFITPSIVDRGRLQIAISTAGAAPVLARELRGQLETNLPNSIQPLMDFVASKRSEVMQKISEGKVRRQFWEQFFKDNGMRFDEQTENYYQNAFSLTTSAVVTEHCLWLIADHQEISGLPIGCVPELQKIEAVYYERPLPFALNELIRRDASRHNLMAFLDGYLAEYKPVDGRFLIVAGADRMMEIRQRYPLAREIKAGSFSIAL